MEKAHVYHKMNTILTNKLPDTVLVHNMFNIWFNKYMLILTRKNRKTECILMCLDNPSAAQKAEFQFEIEQMKLLGSHPNVVSMVGCCTFQDEKFLVIEYVPFGDLLTWLRCRRRRVRK